MFRPISSNTSIVNQPSDTFRYKEYSKLAIDRLILIKQAKRLGFTLTEIHQLIRDFESDKLTDEEKKYLLKKKIESIDEKITELKILRSYLLDKINL